MDKAGLLLGALAVRYQEAVSDRLPPELGGRFPKLSRGENYRGLPYLILDYPAVFDRVDVFAVRTLFWWGHYFSLTLHLKGHYKDRYLPKVLLGLASAGGTGWQVAVSEDEWVHAVEPGAYAAWNGDVTERSFFKMAWVIPLDRWDNVSDLLEERLREVLRWLA
ncbi:hypothetical protein EDB95_0328 [Dinghuibacter silviterrae]|uniref:Uncharacterized protein n=2 Tax=Dinghuibacter silviterrae TaxID=1539049 RepID=A0A4R8DMU3_9BACT|nr:hypothetical protein EDB95_0328 [Dinghuibacter silviterrae]